MILLTFAGASRYLACRKLYDSLEPGDLPVFPQQPDCNDMYAGWCGLCIDLFRIWNLPDEGQTGKFRISLLSLRPAAVTAGLPASAVHAAEEPEA